MISREEILGRLRPLAREVAHPQAWQSPRDIADLAVRFTDSLNSVIGEVNSPEKLEDAFDK
jgi:hypothetical protein